MSKMQKQRMRRDKQEARFAKRISEMSVEYLICHDQRVGHQWTPATLDTPDGNYYCGLLCVRCGLECEMYRDPYTGKSVRRYWHPHPEEYYFLGCGRRSAEQRREIEETWQRELLGKIPRTREENT